MAAVFYNQFVKQTNINSDISSILPAESQEAAQLGKLFNQTTANQLIWMLKAQDEQSLIDAADEISKDLTSSKLLAMVINDSNGLSLLFERLSQNQGIYLSQQDKTFLQNKDFQGITQSKIEKLYSPLSAVNSEILVQDPLLLTTSFLEQSFKNNTAKVIGNYIGYQDGDDIILMLNLQLKGSPFDIELQKEYLSYLDTVEARLSPKNIELMQLGLVGFAAYETQQGLTEAKVIGLGSILVILVLISLIFRSPIPLLLMSLVIATGVICALSVASLLFGPLHVLSILVGTSLIGIAVDYVFHYFAKNAFHPNKVASAKIIKPVTLGLITSILGYSALFLSALEVLQQIAFISSVGLVAAYFSTLVILPAIKFDLSKKSNLSFSIFDRLNQLSNTGNYKTLCLMVCSAILVLAVFLLPKITFNDQVELLHASPKHLIEQQEVIESLVEEAAPSENMVVSANDLEQLLVKLEKLDTLLQQEVANKNLDSYIGLQQFLHSNEYQNQSISLVKDWLNSEYIHDYLEILDLNVIELKASLANDYLNQADFKKTPYAPLIEKLLLKDEQGDFYGLVKLIGVKDLSAISLFVKNEPAISLINPKAQFSDFLAQVRVDSIYFVAAAYLVILLLLIVVNGFKAALKQFIPPLSAALLGLFAAMALGQMINIFHIVALTLVLGIGIDYTIFYANAQQHQKPDMVLAISCSMISTVLAFGLMALSQTPAVSGFGTVVLVGIFSAYLLAPLAKESKA
ncbi:MAG: MMPL family transporter [Gammaproteobacteria bacterium]|nr:MMPL family transporter [Gammaproteobacteria bacterium]